MDLLFSKPPLLIKMTDGLNFAVVMDEISAPPNNSDTIPDDMSSCCLLVGGRVGVGELQHSNLKPHSLFFYAFSSNSQHL
jgi:hypothetical protein